MTKRNIAIVKKIQCPDVERTHAAKESGLAKKLRWTGSTHREEASPKMGNPSKYKIGDIWKIAYAMMERRTRTKRMGV